MNILIQASEKNSNFLFGYIDSQKYPKFLNAYSISSVPTFIVYDASKQVYYNMEGTEHENQPFSISSLTKFLEDVENGKIESKGSGKGILSFIQVSLFFYSFEVLYLKNSLVQCFSDLDCRSFYMWYHCTCLYVFFIFRRRKEKG